VVLAIPSDAQTPCLDSGEAETNGFSKRGSVNMRNSILIADPSIREIEALARNIPIRVWGIVRREPKGGGGARGMQIRTQLQDKKQKRTDQA